MDEETGVTSYLQSIEIVITSAAGAREKHFPCIRQAVEHEIVSFADGGMQKAYSDYEAELLRPQMLESATAEVKKRGLLKNFPDRSSFASLELYAQALERHSRLVPGTALRVLGQTIVFDPPRSQANFSDFDKRYSSLLAVIMLQRRATILKTLGLSGMRRSPNPQASDQAARLAAASNVRSPPIYCRSGRVNFLEMSAKDGFWETASVLYIRFQWERLDRLTCRSLPGMADAAPVAVIRTDGHDR